MSGLDHPATMSPQVGLRMVVRCLPESPFKETVSRVVDGAIHMMDQQEQRITNLVLENQFLNAEIKSLQEDLEALRHEVELTNEHEHQILTERNEARAQLATAKRKHLRRMRGLLKWKIGALFGKMEDTKAHRRMRRYTCLYVDVLHALAATGPK